jgi:MFS family permease
MSQLAATPDREKAKPVERDDWRADDAPSAESDDELDSADEAETSGMISRPATMDGDSSNDSGPPSNSCCGAVRYQLAILSLVASAVCYGQRVGIAVAIVRMQVEMDWDREVQGQILAAFFAGYVLMQMPGGFFATRVGSRRSVTLGLAISSAGSLLIPAVVRTQSLPLLVACRIVQGFGQGLVYPGFTALWGRWSLPKERSRMSAAGSTGSYIGAILFETLAGIQCDVPWIPLFGDWEGVFYLQALCGGMMTVLLWRHIQDTPAKHKRCLPAEVRLLLKAQGKEEDWVEDRMPIGQGFKKWHRVDRTAPVGLGLYKVILTSGPVWAICFAHVANDWSFYVLVSLRHTRRALRAHVAYCSRVSLRSERCSVCKPGGWPAGLHARLAGL